MVEKNRADDAVGIEAYQVQARRLVEYLEAGGHTLKHKNSLEAVAKMHGFKDWHSLSNSQAMKPSAPQSSPSAVEDCFAVVNHFSDAISVASTSSRSLALLDFIQTMRMMADLIGDSSKIRVIGQDVDYSSSRLSLVFDGVVILSLMAAQRIDDTDLVAAPGGVMREVPLKIPNLYGLESSDSFAAIGRAINEALSTRKAEEEGARQTKAGMSLVAVLLGVDADEALEDLAAESIAQFKPKFIEVDPRKLLLALDKVKVMHTASALLLGGEDDL